jgi:hypothetical protein
MDGARKIKIFDSFPTLFEEAYLGISISPAEFGIFEKGIYCTSMDEKWNVFFLNDNLIFARSWTDHCIYKVLVERPGDIVILKSFQVSRDLTQYKSNDIDYDAVSIKKLIQSFLNRDDIYSDPMLELDLIKEMIEKGDFYHNYLKSIGSSTVEFTRNTYTTLSLPPNDSYFIIGGWPHLKENILEKLNNEKLVTLYVRHKHDGFGRTFYFNHDVTEYLGEIVISKTSGMNPH